MRCNEQATIPAFPYDVFIDLTRSTATASRVAEHLRRLNRDEGLFGEGRRVSLALPPNISPKDDDFAPARTFRSPVEALAAALADAATSGRALALIIGDWPWRNQTVCGLGDYIHIDPMIATLQPRFSDRADRHSGVM
jgi:hypothetical protein